MGNGGPLPGTSSVYLSLRIPRCHFGNDRDSPPATDVDVSLASAPVWRDFHLVRRGMLGAVTPTQLT
jgi:hypothetical protein